jgi:precorrin-3B C17-methyltransferase
VTVAVAERVKSKELRVKNKKTSNLITHNPKLFIVGTGPGGIEHITPRAQEAIRESDAVVGYGTYLDLIEDLIKDKQIVSTGMTQEVDRCGKAVELALSGKTVSIISGGDPGIYAMAGLVFELLSAKAMKRASAQEKIYELPRFPASTLSVEVIPGISALNACAARLGAPLMHDFASISLSDRLTPWKLIEKRLESAAMADFVIVLYNPKSKGRPEHIKKAQEIIMKYRNPDTPAGIVKGAMRENEEIVITNLKNMLEHNIDMQTTVIIGNSQTFVWDNLMITPRGYERKFKI